MDVIARCAFGLKIDSLGDKDDPFIRNAEFVFHPPTNKSPFILLPCKLKTIDTIPSFNLKLPLFVSNSYVSQTVYHVW